MQSFQTELESPVVAQDIIDLEKKIFQLRNGEIDEDRFRSLRLARGIYGQRQDGVQMIRIKIPQGRTSFRQLQRIAFVSDKYSTGILHLTTRQDVQIHYVALDDTPQLWTELEKDELTLREACGNTVRNVTASPIAGIDPNEPFDVTPVARAFTDYFLRNPVCQEMGRKIKVAFSSGPADNALPFIHDLGFIPLLQNGKPGFAVELGGGLGAQPVKAHHVFDFLPLDQVIPFSEAVIRVFDRHGERLKRHKARLKYLVQELGIDPFLELVDLERRGLPFTEYPIALEQKAPEDVPAPAVRPEMPENLDAYVKWKSSNAIRQKQPGYFAAHAIIPRGNISTEKLRDLLRLLRPLVGSDIRITPDQNLQFRFVPEAYLPNVFNALHSLNLHQFGYNTLGDITSCPGTDTCNLGIASSYGATEALQDLIYKQYEDLILHHDLNIKISGCMNACGQHPVANIGLHGSSIRVRNAVLPALQIMLGGGYDDHGQGVFAERVIKIPSKRILQGVSIILDDFVKFRGAAEGFNQYYRRKGKAYFYGQLKALADVREVAEEEYIDWGKSGQYVQKIGVGECAGVVIDLVKTLFLEAREKLEQATFALENGKYAHTNYHAYSALVTAAKALLVFNEVECRSQIAIINAFDELGLRLKDTSFKATALLIRERKPTRENATAYLNVATAWVALIEKQHANSEQHGKHTT